MMLRITSPVAMCLPGVPGAILRCSNCRDPADPAGLRVVVRGSARQRVRRLLSAGQGSRPAGASPGYYVRAIAVTIGLLAAGWTTFAVLGNSWWQLAVAAFLAVVFTQIGFLGHDAGHRQVFSTRRASYVTGILLGNLGIGLSYCWWVDKHNRHHAHPNTEDADPDIAVGALAFSSAQAGPAGAWPGWCSATRRTCSSRCCSAKRSTCTSRASGH